MQLIAILTVIRQPDSVGTALRFRGSLLYFFCLPEHGAQQPRRGRPANVYQRFGHRWSFNNLPRQSGKEARMRSCNWWVLAAEARKAGSASEATLRVPRPPSLIGRVVWSHWLSDRALLLMPDTADFSKSSNLSSHFRSAEGEQRSRCWTLGALKDARNKRLDISGIIDFIVWRVVMPHNISHKNTRKDEHYSCTLARGTRGAEYVRNDNLEYH